MPSAENRRRITISAAVATYNEEAHIARCLRGLLAQEDEGSSLEILVVDGISDDRTCEIVRALPEYGKRIHLLVNTRRLQAYAWNQALRVARGEYFAMVVAHADYGPRYFASCLEVMQRTGATAVGGVQIPYGEGPLGVAIAWSMASALGVGDARFRYTQTEEHSDSVFSIFTKVSTLKALDGYDERIAFDEDSDLNYRIRLAGGRLITSPTIPVRYHVRRSLRALSRQMYRYGYWRRVTQLKHPRRVPVRTYAPGALVALLVASGLFAATGRGIGASLVPGLYAGLLAVSAISAIRKTRLAAALVPAALATMHVSYGLGWWSAFFAVRHPPEPPKSTNRPAAKL